MMCTMTMKPMRRIVRSNTKNRNKNNNGRRKKEKREVDITMKTTEEATTTMITVTPAAKLCFKRNR